MAKRRLDIGRTYGALSDGMKSAVVKATAQRCGVDERSVRRWIATPGRLKILQREVLEDELNAARLAALEALTINVPQRTDDTSLT